MENTITIWVCVDCMLHHANGECGSCHDVRGHDEEPWSKLDDGEHVVRGGEGDEYDSYSTSPCHGCGSWLHGERHAFTLWFPVPETRS